MSISRPTAGHCSVVVVDSRADRISVVSVKRQDKSARHRTRGERDASASSRGSAAIGPEVLAALRRRLRDTVAQFADTARQLEREIADLEQAAPRPGTEADRLADVFTCELRSLLGDDLPDDEVVRRAARQTFAEQAWRRRLGELVDVAGVVDLLGVSRQHVNTLINQHRLIALPVNGRRRLPVWQFAGSDGAQRTCLAAAHRELVHTGGLSPWAAAAWLQADHPELDARDPLGFLRAGGGCERVLAVAGRDAARAAQ